MKLFSRLKYLKESCHYDSRKKITASAAMLNVLKNMGRVDTIYGIPSGTLSHDTLLAEDKDIRLQVRHEETGALAAVMRQIGGPIGVAVGLCGPVKATPLVYGAYDAAMDNTHSAILNHVQLTISTWMLSKN